MTIEDPHATLPFEYLATRGRSDLGALNEQLMSDKAKLRCVLDCFSEGVIYNEEKFIKQIHPILDPNQIQRDLIDGSTGDFVSILRLLDSASSTNRALGLIAIATFCNVNLAGVQPVVDSFLELRFELRKEEITIISDSWIRFVYEIVTEFVRSVVPKPQTPSNEKDAVRIARQFIKYDAGSAVNIEESLTQTHDWGWLVFSNPVNDSTLANHFLYAVNRLNGGVNCFKKLSIETVVARMNVWYERELLRVESKNSDDDSTNEKSSDK